MASPIKRHPAIQQLSRDHHFALLFCWKIRQGLHKQVETSRMKKYVAYFQQHYLIPHFQEEEQILFCLLPDDAQVKKAIGQHREIEKIVKDQLIAPERIHNSLTDDIPALAALVNLLDEHVRYEERVLFPYLEKQLSEAQLQQVGEQLARAQQTQSPDDVYPDAFWAKKNMI